MSDIVGMTKSVFRNIISVYNFLADHAFQLSISHRLILFPVNVEAVIDSGRSVAEGFFTEETIQRYFRLSLLSWLGGATPGLVELKYVLSHKPLATGLAVELQIFLSEIFVEILCVVLVNFLLMGSQIFSRLESSVAQLTGENLCGWYFSVDNLVVLVEDILSEEEGGNRVSSQRSDLLTRRPAVRPDCLSILSRHAKI